MSIKKHITPVLAACFLASTATASDSTPGAPALRTVVDAAFERNPEITLTGAIRQEGEALRQQATSLLADNPSVVIRHESDEITDDNGFRNWEGSMHMPIWLPGQRKQRVDVANAAELEAASLAPFYKWRASGEVRELLWSIRIAEVEASLAQTAVDSARALESDVDKRVQAGELAVTDQILARKETLAHQIKLGTANAHLENLLREYRVLTGLTALPENLLEEDITNTDIIKQHPALIAAGMRTDRARAERNQSHREKRANPVLAVGAKNERAENGMPYDTIMTLELNLPLGLKGQSAPAIASAERHLTEQQISYASVQRDLDKTLDIAILEKQHTAQALKLALEQRQLASEGLRLARRAFELGESDLYTLLRAHTQALAADRDYQIRELEQGRAIARYNQALGVIPQ